MDPRAKRSKGNGCCLLVCVIEDRAPRRDGGWPRGRGRGRGRGEEVSRGNPRRRSIERDGGDVGRWMPCPAWEWATTTRRAVWVGEPMGP